MSLPVYTDIVRYSNTIMAAFFGYHGLLSLLIYRGYKRRQVSWHALSCFSVAGYSALYVINSFFEETWINELYWVLGALAYFSYLRVVVLYVPIAPKSRKVILGFFFVLLLLVSIGLLARVVLGAERAPLFRPGEPMPAMLIVDALHAYTGPTRLGRAVGFVSIVATGITSGLLLYLLWTARPRDIVLALGVVGTLVSTLNDVLITVGVFTSSIPLFFLGYLFEASRFVTVFQKESFDRVKTVEAARDEAEVLSKTKSEFLSRMSHELRTPMNSILGFSQLLLSAQNLTDDQLGEVHEIRNAGHQLLILINEALELSSIESGVIDLSWESFNVRLPIFECISNIAPEADRRGIGIDVTCPDRVHVYSDRSQFCRIVRELLYNAISRCRDGDAVRIRVDTENVQMIRIVVSHNGAGIDADRIDVAFQPFERGVAQNSQSKGTRLGLAVVKRTVELIGGRMGVDSASGNANTVWIELPKATNPENRKRCCHDRLGNATGS